MKGRFDILFVSISLVFLMNVWRAQGQSATAPPPDTMKDAIDTLLDFSTAPVHPSEPAETNRVKLLHKQATALRDPFWPVGYTPPQKKPPQPAPADQPTPQPQTESVPADRPPKWDEAMRMISIKGIMSVGEGKYMAVVNDQVVNENDTVSVTFEGRRYSWKIVRIAADGVKFQKLTATK